MSGIEVLALTGGIGGAKLALGLSRLLPVGALACLVNTGDDFEHLGLHISPDLDTTLYTLAGLANPELGWGRRDETWSFMQALAELGGESWFRLGDADLALHVERTRRLAAGETLSAVMDGVRRGLGVSAVLLPMCDEAVRTRVHTPDGSLAFQDYFVRQRAEPVVRAVSFEGAERARPTAGLEAALGSRALRAIVVCPSNPWLSIDPILAVPGIATLLRARGVPVVAVSPLVGGRAVKGPADRMLARMAGGTEPAHVASCYEGLIDALVVDESDPAGELTVRRVVTQTLMTDLAASRRLAETVLEAAA